MAGNEFGVETIIGGIVDGKRTDTHVRIHFKDDHELEMSKKERTQVRKVNQFFDMKSYAKLDLDFSIDLFPHGDITVFYTRTISINITSVGRS